MIFSIGVRHRIVRTVDMVCPRCGLDRCGSVVSPSRWATLASVPIVPLGEHEDVVICDECGHTSDLGVLDVPTTQQLAVLLEDAWISALVIALRADGPDIDPASLERARCTLAEAGFDATAPGLDGALAALGDLDAQRRLRRLAPEMTAFGKQGFLHRVAAVIMNHDALTPNRRDALAAIGFDLGMAAPHINGVLAVASVPTDA